MAEKTTGTGMNPIDSGLGPAQVLQFGRERTETMLKTHRELLDAYQEASRAWVDRVKSEVEFWSELAAKLAASRSIPEGLEAYSGAISARMEMVAEDGRRMLADGQKMMSLVMHSVSDLPSAKNK